MAAYRLLRGTPVSPVPGTSEVRSRAGLSKSGPQAELLGNAPERAKAHVGEPAETVWKWRGSRGGTFIKEGWGRHGGSGHF